jgi:hypothetical protein
LIPKKPTLDLISEIQEELGKDIGGVTWEFFICWDLCFFLLFVFGSY